MVHETKFMGQPANAVQLKARSETLTIGDERTIAIMKEHLTLDEARWDDFHRNEIWFTADEAVHIGMIDSIADFMPPTGAKIFDFNSSAV